LLSLLSCQFNALLLHRGSPCSLVFFFSQGNLFPSHFSDVLFLDVPSLNLKECFLSRAVLDDERPVEIEDGLVDGPSCIKRRVPLLPPIGPCQSKTN
jgi:hypothetical protein